MPACISISTATALPAIDRSAAAVPSDFQMTGAATALPVSGRQFATESEVDRLCDEAAEFRFASVCVNPVFVERSRRRLEGTEVLTCTVIGFPLGATLSVYKTL